MKSTTGSATFLRKVIDLVHERVVKIEKQGGNWDGYVRTHLLPRLFGFELMMAPYTVAHLKLALQLQQQGFSFAPGERLHVYLTNTLAQQNRRDARPMDRGGKRRRRASQAASPG